MRRRASPLVALVALVGLGLASASDASAHAYLESSVPAVGASLSQAPQQLRLTFTEPLDSSFSNVQVLNARREQVDRGDSRIAPERTDAADGPQSIMRAIRNLNRRDRLLIALRAEGCSYREIAAAAGLAPASTGRIVARALARLAETLGVPR